MVVLAILVVEIIVVIPFIMKQMTLELCLRLKQPQRLEAKGLLVVTIPYHQTTNQVRGTYILWCLVDYLFRVCMYAL